MTLTCHGHSEFRIEAGEAKIVIDSFPSDNTSRDKGWSCYRKEQLRRLQEEVIEMEDLKTGVSITDLGLNDFRMDLLNYVKANGDLDGIPSGMHAVVPAAPERGLPPGVVFTLRNRNQSVNVNRQNRVHPYYLIYVSGGGRGRDARVIADHTEVKRVLDLVRTACKGRAEPVPETEKLAAIQRNPALAGLKVEIEQLFAQSGKVAAGREDRPKREGKLGLLREPDTAAEPEFLSGAGSGQALDAAYEAAVRDADGIADGRIENRRQAQCLGDAPCLSATPSRCVWRLRVENLADCSHAGHPCHISQQGATQGIQSSRALSDPLQEGHFIAQTSNIPLEVSGGESDECRERRAWRSERMKSSAPPRRKDTMRLFAVDNENAITSLPAAEQVPEGQEYFATEKELTKLTASWPADRLVETWNSFAGVAGFGVDLKPVKKFTNRKAAVARIWKAIQRLDGDMPEPAATETAATGPKAAKGASKKGKAPKTTTAKTAARTAREGSKKATIMGMLVKGATLQELMAAAGWQSHYADVRIMPTCAGNPAYGAVIAALESA